MGFNRLGPYLEIRGRSGLILILHREFRQVATHFVLLAATAGAGSVSLGTFIHSDALPVVSIMKKSTRRVGPQVYQITGACP